MQSRGNGRTTRQMLFAPRGAHFIWVSNDISYPLALAKKCFREDLRIVGPSWITTEKFRAEVVHGIILDHAVRLTEEEFQQVFIARSRIGR
jgi:hypothetical protein